MSDTTAALRAAKEVQADVLAPELYRQANEWFLKARKEYKFKNFELAKAYATRARKLAEQAEFQVIQSGGNRGDAPPDTNADAAATAPAPSSTPYDYPTPTGTPASDAPPGGSGTSGGQNPSPNANTPPASPPSQ